MDPSKDADFNKLMHVHHKLNKLIREQNTFHQQWTKESNNFMNDCDTIISRIDDTLRINADYV